MTHLSSQFGATEGAESEVSLHGAVAEAAAQGVGDRRRRCRFAVAAGRQGVIVREEVLTTAAIQERILRRPPPDGNEEELENLVVVDEIHAVVGAERALAHTGFQHLPYLLLQPSHEEKEHCYNLS